MRLWNLKRLTNEEDSLHTFWDSTDVVFHCGTYRGKHHKSTASSLFHQALIAQLKAAKTKTEALRIIEDMHEKHVLGYKRKR